MMGSGSLMLKWEMHYLMMHDGEEEEMNKDCDSYYDK
jgi:hypothetical protein